MREDWILVKIVRVLGSAPRAEGTRMWISSDSQVGSIGGGQLELLATERARNMIAEGLRESEVSLPLGPVLAQCCGGIVDLMFIAVEEPETNLKTGFPMVLYGLGHVGSAIATIMSTIPYPLLTFDDRVELGAAYSDLSSLMDSIPLKAYHLVMTYSHETDFEICRTLIEQDVVGCIGLIGSKSKKARFKSRLKNLGLDSDRINCPIGIVGILGKEPSVIAVSVVAEFLLWQAAQSIKN
ncbi:xanthine dehydrogenase accessory protein XdhC [Litorivicinus sp.]|nr:xanthine dehydrogenase accessory protein XdhC [Litorivicinus sp.]